MNRPKNSQSWTDGLAYLTAHRSISYSSSRRKRAIEILIPLAHMAGAALDYGSVWEQPGLDSLAADVADTVVGLVSA